MDEEPLSGGNVSAGVVRVGDTVRRPAGPQTPAVHALLRHLHDVGFRHVPRPLGVDGQGREVLTFVPGTAVFPHRVDLLDGDGPMRAVGRLVRDLHDACAEFVAPPDALWQTPIPDVGADQIVHHDLAPWNVIASDAAPWTVIDWDAAGPGTRLWDLAYAAHGFLPLSADPAWARPDAAHRLRVLVDAYGLDEPDRLRLLDLLPARTRSMHDFLAAQHALGGEPWTRLWDEGHGRTWLADTELIVGRSADWRRALLG